ncbi:hypothetical protein SAMN05216390_1308 [Lachnospiraceae bacterium KH1T2]|nr:hypothetical protein SAMN05216390_1308 [Lachnospiraceae bacterium KH1T2]
MKNRIFILGIILVLGAFGCSSSSLDSSGYDEGSSEEDIEEAIVEAPTDWSGQQIIHKDDRYYILSTYDNCIRSYDDRFEGEKLVAEPGKGTPAFYRINEFTVGKGAVYVCGTYSENDAEQHIVKILLKDGEAGTTEEIYSFSANSETQLEYDNDSGVLNIFYVEDADSKCLSKVSYVDGKISTDDNAGDFISTLQGTILTNEWQKKNLNYRIYISDSNPQEHEYLYSVKDGAAQMKIDVSSDAEIVAVMEDYVFFYESKENRYLLFELASGNVSDITKKVGNIDVKNVNVNAGRIFYSTSIGEESVLNSYNPTTNVVDTIIDSNLENAAIIGIIDGKIIYEAKKDYDTYIFSYNMADRTTIVVGNPLDTTYITDVGYIEKRSQNVMWSENSGTVVGYAKLSVLVLNDYEKHADKINAEITQVYQEIVDDFAKEITEELPDEDAIPSEDKDAYKGNTLTLETARISYLDDEYLSFCIDGYKRFNNGSVEFYVRKDVIIDRKTGKLVQIPDIVDKSKNEILDKVKAHIEARYKLSENNEEDISLLDRISMENCSFLMCDEGFLVHAAPGFEPVSEADYLEVNIPYSDF